MAKIEEGNATEQTQHRSPIRETVCLYDIREVLPGFVK